MLHERCMNAAQLIDKKRKQSNCKCYFTVVEMLIKGTTMHVKGKHRILARLVCLLVRPRLKEGGREKTLSSF